MRRANSNHPRWFFVPFSPDIDERFRRWKVAIIAVLAFLVLGVFAASSVPQMGKGASTASATRLKIHKQHTP